MKIEIIKQVNQILSADAKNARLDISAQIYKLIRDEELECLTKSYFSKIPLIGGFVSSSGVYVSICMSDILDNFAELYWWDRENNIFIETLILQDDINVSTSIQTVGPYR